MMIKRNKEKEERDLAADKFFKSSKRALYDIVPRGKEPVLDLPDRQENTSGENGEPSAEVPAPRRGERLRTGRNWKLRAWLVSGVVVLVGGAAYALVALPEASIEVVLRQEPWVYNGELDAELQGGEVPLQVFTESKNSQLGFPASGRERVSRRAHGTLKVCNAFSSDPQPLVATTRFLTPDGALFRLDGGITVPGAKITDGKVEAQCIGADVAADKPGEEYNIGPVPRWSIPGFQGTPRYEGFYGVSESAMTGGVVGEVPVPTDEDIALAKEAAHANIREVLSTAFRVRVPAELTILDDGEGEITITKEAAIEETDENGNFQYFIEGRDERVAVREVDVASLLAKRAGDELGAEYELASSRLDMRLVALDRNAKGEITGATISANFSGGFTKRITEEEVRKEAAGKTESDIRNFILSRDEIESARITLWPFWVKRVPEKADKIGVTINIGPISLPALDASGTREGATSSDEAAS